MQCGMKKGVALALAIGMSVMALGTLCSEGIMVHAEEMPAEETQNEETPIVPEEVAAVGDATYELSYDLKADNTLKITGYTGTPSGDLVIPSEIDGKRVTEIGDCAFIRCNGFTGTLTIPDGVTTIGEGAFARCKGFTGTLTIPSSVTTIGTYAFWGCSGFTGNLSLSNVTTFGDNAFSGCSGFNGRLTLDDNVTDLGKQTFQNCSNLTGTVTIPSGVTCVKAYVFNGCSSISGVVFQNTLTKIGVGAFEGCSGVTGTLTIPSSVTQISGTAFSGMTGVETITNNSSRSLPCSWFLGEQDVYFYTDGDTSSRYYANDSLRRGTFKRGIVVSSITLNKQTATVNKGKTLTLQKTILPSNPTDNQVTWTSSDDTVAMVNANGVVTAKAKGTAVITCRAADGSNKQATCTVTVVIPNPVTKISLNQTYASIHVGKTETITATVAPSNAANKQVTWTSSNPAVATVNANGVVTAKTVGTAVITCRAADGSGKYANCSVSVNNYTQTQSFADRLYSKCLGRPADSSGLNHWDQTLLSKQRTGASVAYGFVFSEEYKKKNTTNEEYVDMLYAVFMDRQPDAAGRQHWVNYLENGMSREFVFRGFAQSGEYTGICNEYGIERGSVTLTQARDQNPKLTAYVNRMYTKALSRPGEEGGLNHWCATIQGGTKSPEQVAESFICSQEFKSKNLSDEEYIKVLYQTFMGREYDAGGLAHWKSELARGCSRENILHRFANSTEFKGIQASFGL